LAICGGFCESFFDISFKIRGDVMLTRQGPVT